MSEQHMSDGVRYERERARVRRARVLAWPAIAARLTEEPLNYKWPEQWNGYVPPANRAGGSVEETNVSIRRQALIDICNEVAEAERHRDETGEGPAEIVTPSMPGSITPKMLTRLHIMFTEAGISERDDKLGYCQSVIDRPIDSTKSLSRNEASQVMNALEQIINPEEKT